MGFRPSHPWAFSPVQETDGSIHSYALLDIEKEDSFYIAGFVAFISMPPTRKDLLLP